MAGVPAEEPTLAVFQLPHYLGAGNLPWPGTQIASMRFHRGDEIDITLDRGLLTNAGVTTVLHFVAPNDWDIQDFVHYVPSEHFFQWAGSILATADRGEYHITGITLTQVSSGLQTMYTPGELGAQGFSTDFFIPGHENPLLLDWRNSNGIVAEWRTASTDASLNLRAGSALIDLGVDPSWTAVETMTTAHLDGAILWHNADGRISVGYGADPSSGGPLIYNHDPVSAEWSIAATGDANADGQGEILWRRSDGAISTWSATGQAVTYTYDGTFNHYAPGGSFAENTYYHPSIGADWMVEGMADFSGDNRSDILWRDTDGSLSTWNAVDAGTGIGFQENSWYHAPVSLDWHVVGLGDFNGDGKDDILWHNDDGALSVWTSTGSGFVENQMNASAATSWQIVEAGDVNGDAKADILWRNSDGAISVWTSSGSSWSQNVYYDGSVGTDWSLIAHHFVL